MSAPVQTSTPQNGTPSDAGAKRAAVISGLEEIAKQQAVTPAVAPVEPAPAEETPPEQAPETPVDPEKPADPVPDEEKQPEKPDPDTEKRLGIVEKQEKRMRDQLSRERAEMLATFEREKSVWLDKVKAAESVLDEVRTAKRDPLRAMKAIGITEADFERVARLLYAHSEDGAKNPANKAAAEQAWRERQQQGEIEALLKRIDSMEASQKEVTRRAEGKAQIDAYLGGVTKAVTDDHPLARASLDKAPEKTRQILLDIACKLEARDGETPDASDVLKAYEAQRRAELEELGIDPATVIKAKPRGLPTKPGATVTPANKATTPPAPANRKPTREEILAGLERLSD